MARRTAAASSESDGAEADVDEFLVLSFEC